MDVARWKRLMELFEEARQRTGDARAEFLREACAGDRALREEVESLLAADADADGFLEPEAPAVLHAAVMARRVDAFDDGGTPTDRPPLIERLQSALGAAYRVERELGGGGMSRVFVAEETKLDRRVVVKVLPPELGAALDIERFRREVRLSATLRHPHIVPVLTADESADGLFYYTMPFIEGESLQQRLDREGQLPVADAVRIVHEVAGALAHAHRRGVVHRDVKPANVLVDGDHVLVSDFGIAKAISDSADDAHGTDSTSEHSGLTARGLIVGTPSYMSPEQARGEDAIDGRSDIYSLGCMALEMLTGERPPAATRDATPPASHLTDAMARRSDLSPGCGAVIARAIAWQPEDRFPTADAFATALESALRPGAMATTSERTTPAPSRSRRRVLTMAFGVSVVVVGALAVTRGRLWNTIAAATRSVPPTLAILPFTNVGAAGDEYFAEGIAEEISTRLSRVAGLRVIAWTSTSALGAEGMRASDIGRAVAAGYVLEGSVRWVRDAGPRGAVRITPRLVRVSDTTQVWSQTYDADLTNLLEIQGTVAERVAAELDVALAGPERTAALSRGTRNAEAYDEYLRGNALTARRLRYVRAARLEAVEHYERAVALDPTFASAWARLARAKRQTYLRDDQSPAVLARAREAAERAMALDSTLADANLAMGELADRPWQSVERALSALRTNPNNAELYRALGNAQVALGLLDDALASHARAVALDPRTPDWYASLAEVYDFKRQFGEAIRVREQQIALDSTNSVPFLAQAISYVNWRGDTAAARVMLARGVAAAGRPPLVRAFARLSGLRALRVLSPVLDDETRAAIDTLSLAGAQTSPWLFHRLEAEHLERAGRTAAARAQYDSLRMAAEAAARALPRDPEVHESLGLALAALGVRDSALAAGRRAMAFEPPITQDVGRAWRRYTFAMIAARAGDREAALQALDAGLPGETPVVSPYWLQLDPVWSPLRLDPRFVRLAREP